jgi:DNA helicase HerA-like ATPase
MSKLPTLNLGAWRQLDGTEGGNALRIPAHHLVRHSVVLGMTGSGKTGFVTVLVEEALRAGIPTIIIDVKGDLPNLLLTYPSFDPALLRPWVEGSTDNGPSSGITQSAAQRSEERQKALSAVAIGEPELQRFSDGISVRVITPGASAGESLHVLSALERRSSRWDTDPESARNALSAAVSSVLRLLGRDPGPARSREHVLLSVLAERRLAAGQNADIAALMQDLTNPPIAEIRCSVVQTG